MHEESCCERSSWTFTLLARRTFGLLGAHDHAVEGHVVARGDELVGALDLHDAHAAAADLVQVLEVAQGGDLDARPRRRLKDGGALGHLDANAVDGKPYHCSILPPRNAP